MIKVDSSCTMQFVTLFQDRKLVLKLTGGQSFINPLKTLSVLYLECILFLWERVSRFDTCCSCEIPSCTLACTSMSTRRQSSDDDVSLSRVVDVMSKNTRNQ